MKSADLSPLITPPPGLAPLGFHIGQVATFNQATGENTISVAGALFTDLPMLNIGDTVNLAVGDTVALQRYRNTYFIIGRVVAPNSTVFANTSVDFESNNVGTGGYAITTTEAIVATATMSVPLWADRALIHATCHFGGSNSRAVFDFMRGAVWVGSDNGGQLISHTVGANSLGFVSASHSIEAAVTGGQSLDVTGRCRTDGGTWSASGFNLSRLTVTAVYRKA